MDTMRRWYKAWRTSFMRGGYEMMGPAIEMSPELRAFLEERAAMKLADAIIARSFLAATLEPDDKGSYDNAHNYFDIRHAKVGARLSYTTQRKVAESGNLPYAPKGHRVVAKAGAVARRVAGATDSMGRELDVFTNAVIAAVMPEQRVDIINGEMISHVYQAKNNCKCINTGPLRNSCMRPNSLADEGTFKLYEDVAELAVIFCQQCGNIKARTVLWTDSKNRKWHDRVYANDVDAAMIHHWAVNSGVGNLRTTDYRIQKVEVKLPKGHAYKRYPSLDTMRLCVRCGILRNGYCDKHGYR